MALPAGLAKEATPALPRWALDARRRENAHETAVHAALDNGVGGYRGRLARADTALDYVPEPALERLRVEGRDDVFVYARMANTRADDIAARFQADPDSIVTTVFAGAGQTTCRCCPHGVDCRRPDSI
jgi:hypothetical protein